MLLAQATLEPFLSIWISNLLWKDETQDFFANVYRIRGLEALKNAFAWYIEGGIVSGDKILTLALQGDYALTEFLISDNLPIKFSTIKTSILEYLKNNACETLLSKLLGSYLARKKMLDAGNLFALCETNCLSILHDYVSKMPNSDSTIKAYDKNGFTLLDRVCEKSNDPNFKRELTSKGVSHSSAYYIIFLG